MARGRDGRGRRLATLRSLTGARLALAALFALSLAAPQAALVQHRHAGGDHAHVHGHALADEADHHHQQQGPRGPAYAGDHGETRAHVHHQQRYQAALATIVAFVAVSAPLAPFVPASCRPAPAPVVRAASARAPPLLSIA
jgi:hypothetical protein